MVAVYKTLIISTIVDIFCIDMTTYDKMSIRHL